MGLYGTYVRRCTLIFCRISVPVRQSKGEPLFFALVPVVSLKRALVFFVLLRGFERRGISFIYGSRFENTAFLSYAPALKRRVYFLDVSLPGRLGR